MALTADGNPRSAERRFEHIGVEVEYVENLGNTSSAPLAGIDVVAGEDFRASSCPRIALPKSLGFSACPLPAAKRPENLSSCLPSRNEGDSAERVWQRVLGDPLDCDVDPVGRRFRGETPCESHERRRRPLVVVDVSPLLANVEGLKDRVLKESLSLRAREVSSLGAFRCDELGHGAVPCEIAPIEVQTVSIADDLKAAGSDALKKAASLLGVALHLYGGSEEPAAPPRAAGPAPASPNDRLTGKQFSAIQSVARRHNIGRDHLTHMLEERFKKTELGHLSRREASSLLSELTEANGAHP